MILLTPTNREELDDLVYIANSQGWEYEVFSFQEKRFSVRSIDKIYAFLGLVTLCIKKRPSVILGAPSFKSRMASAFLGIRYCSYLRGLHPASAHASSLSDKVYFFFRRLNLGKKSKFLNNYQADHCFVSSPITEKFLVERDVPKEQISVVGPVWLEKLPVMKSGNGFSARVFFITQSYAEHKLNEAAEAQLSIINKLRAYCKNHNLDFCLKKHPRDMTDYGDINCFQGDAEIFTDSLSQEDIVVSAFSTLAFEIQYLGGNVVFILFEGLDLAMKDAFEFSGVQYLDWANVNSIDSLCTSRQDSKKIFSTINLDAFTSNVIK